MNSRQPPTLAVWLLNRILLIGSNEPFAGDLLEEFSNGRTAGWYWRQTFMAIVAAFGQRLRIFKLDLQVLFAGWGAHAVVVAALWWFHVPFGLPTIAFGIFGMIVTGLICYLACESIARALFKRKDLSVDAFVGLLRAATLPRYLGVARFIAYLSADCGYVVLTGLRWPLGASDFSHSSPRLFAWTIVWLAWDVTGVLRSPPDSAMKIIP